MHPIVYKIQEQASIEKDHASKSSRATDKQRYLARAQAFLDAANMLKKWENDHMEKLNEKR